MNHPNVHIKSECIYGDTYVYPLNIVHLALRATIVHFYMEKCIYLS